MVQLRVCTAGAVPLIEHVPGPAYAGLICQLMPDPVGSVSVRVTPCAVPALVVAFWGLETVTLNPMLLPALTLAASAVLPTVRLGTRTPPGEMGLSLLPCPTPSTKFMCEWSEPPVTFDAPRFAPQPR